MPSTFESLKILSDQTRLRLVSLLRQEELSVGEMQTITLLGQSRISSQLSSMAKIGLLASRREGRSVFYRINRDLARPVTELIRVALEGCAESPEFIADEVNLRRAIAKREELVKINFEQVAGRFDRSYGPGRSWQAFGNLLLHVFPPLTVADLGSGEGLLAELLALRAKQVIAVDNSPKMIEYGQRKSREKGLDNLEFRFGDLAAPPIDDTSVDLVIISQALHHTATPQQAVESSWRILRSGGRLAILDLLRHNYEETRSLYGDLWLGFLESELQEWLENAGFSAVDVSRVAREPEPPHFETLLALGTKLESLADSPPDGL